MRLAVFLLLAAHASTSAVAAAQPTRPTSTTQTRRDSIRESIRETVRDAQAAQETRRDSLARVLRERGECSDEVECRAVARNRRRPPVRQEVTPELDRSAFGDATARTLLARARAARLSQDSALRAYDAKTYQRISVGMGIRRLGPDRLLFRTENSAHVRWGRESGVWIEPTGKRAVFPMVKEAEGEIDMDDAAPLPYFPGRETLWFPSSDMGVARTDVDEREMLHPLANGAEAYYRYQTGDSVRMRLPDGRVISLRELRITARKPEWRAFVGSFWFDVDRGSLVRAAYRMAADMDIWQVASEENRRDLAEIEARLRTDTGAARARTQRRLEQERDDAPPKWVTGLLSPMRANISAITVEYGLYEGRFWLPKLNVAEGEAQAGFMKMPVRMEESFKYNAVNGEPPPAVPTRAQLAASGLDTMPGIRQVSLTVGDNDRTRAARADTSALARAAREDSVVRRYARRADSLRTVADDLRAKGDTAQARRLTTRAATNERLARNITRRREECARDSSYFAGTSTRYDGAVRVAVRLPCDSTRLANSPDLPGSIYEPGEQLFGATERDALLSALDFGLQPGWAPQKPRLHTGLDLLRYNRVEGLSVGATATSALGRGYTAQALARVGTADWVPNAELSLARSNGRADVRLGVYHRLGVANDDWGSPLSFGASLANLLYARDEGFYYRTFGAELGGTRPAPGPLGGATLAWRAFAERQRSAGVEPNTQLSLGHAWANAAFGANVAANQLTALGVGGELARTFGADPTGTRLDSRVRAEAAATDRSDSVGTSGYGRLVFDGTLSRGFGRVAAAVTGAGGVSAGDLPAQRAFYVGGLQTVRGQFARPAGAGRVGDAFWMTRAELGLGLVSARPVVFYDLGWAGARADVSRPGRPLSGAGVGVSFLDGMVRFDVARGIHPEKRTRADIYLEARF